MDHTKDDETGAAQPSGTERAAKPPVGSTDLARTVGEMRRLLEQIEESDRAQDDPASGQHLAVVARMLQYVHDSHSKIVDTLKEQDRSELFLQSTQALNQTFRRLNQSQDALVEKLLAERRRNPWYLVAGAAVVAVVVVAALFVLIDHRNGGLRDEVDRMAATRDGLSSIAADSQRAFNEMGTRLAETVDKTLAANRVLDNENRAKAQELAATRSALDAVTARKDELEAERVKREQRVSDLERERQVYEGQVAELRTKLLDKELAASNIEKLLDDRLGKRTEAGTEAKSVGEQPSNPAAPEDGPAPDESAKTPAATKPDRDGSSTAESTEASDSTTPEPPTATEAVPADDSSASGTAASDPPSEAPPAAATPEPEESPFDRTTNAVNDFLGAAGVIDHRLLRHGAVADGELRDVVLELRSAEGRPIGSRTAAGMKISVDPGRWTARLILRDGETVERGQRSPFPPEGFEVAIAAIARESITVSELLPFLVLETPVPEAKPEVRRAERFDSREPLALLNRELGAAGRAYVRFAVLGGIDAGRLTDVELNHYTGAGALLKTVVARSCAIEVDAANRRVRLVFRDGHHRQNGREVPFFKGRADGEVTTSWTLELEDVDTAAWEALRDTLASERFVE